MERARTWADVFLVKHLSRNFFGLIFSLFFFNTCLNVSCLH